MFCSKPQIIQFVYNLKQHLEECKKLQRANVQHFLHDNDFNRPFDCYDIGPIILLKLFKHQHQHPPPLRTQRE